MILNILIIQVIDIERDIRLAKAGKRDLVYKTLVGLKSDLSKPALVPEILAEKSENKSYKSLQEKSGKTSQNDDSEEDSDESEYDGTSDEVSEEDSESEKESKFVNSARPKNETAEERKVLLITHYNEIKSFLKYFVTFIIWINH